MSDKILSFFPISDRLILPVGYGEVETMGQFGVYPNNRFGIAGHFQYKADLIIKYPIQLLHYQYLHSKGPYYFRTKCMHF
jgi:hypothetical protein